MKAWLNKILDRLSDFLAHRKGLLPLLGLVLITANFILQFFPNTGWVSGTNFFLHIGIFLAILGFLLAWAL